jgi:hypothetical protein
MRLAEKLDWKGLESTKFTLKHLKTYKIRYITDGNDVRSHTAQIYNDRTSTDLNLVTVKNCASYI